MHIWGTLFRTLAMIASVGTATTRLPHQARYLCIYGACRAATMLLAQTPALRHCGSRRRSNLCLNLPLALIVQSYAS